MSTALRSLSFSHSDYDNTPSLCFHILLHTATITHSHNHLWSCWWQDPCLIYLYNPFVQHMIRHQAGYMGMIQLVLLLCSVIQSCPALCDPMDCSTPGSPVLLYLPEFVQTPLSLWYHPTISSVTTFSSCPQSFPASRSFPVNQLFTSGGQSIVASASASVLPMNIQDWFPLGLTSLISLLFRGLSRVFSSTTVQKDQFFELWFKAMKLKDACSLKEKLWQT